MKSRFAKTCLRPGAFATLLMVSTVGAQPYSRDAILPRQDADFGSAIASVGRHIGIGGPGDNSPGSVVLFDRRTLDPAIAITSPTPAMFDRYGAAIATVGADFVIGAPGAAEVHIVDHTGAHKRTIAAPDAVPSEERAALKFGAAVGGSRGRVVAMSLPTPSDLAAGNTLTTVYAFDAQTGSTTWSRPIETVLAAGLAVRGELVAVATKCMACPSGREVLVLDLSSGMVLQRLAPPPQVDASMFGSALFIERSRILVGAPASDGGSAIEYRARSGRIVAVYRDPAEAGPSLHQRLGSPVALAGRFALLSATHYAGVHVGRVYVFDRKTGTIAQRIEGFSDVGRFGGVISPLHRSLFVGYANDRLASVEVFSR